MIGPQEPFVIDQTAATRNALIAIVKTELSGELFNLQTPWLLNLTIAPVSRYLQLSLDKLVRRLEPIPWHYAKRSLVLHLVQP